MCADIEKKALWVREQQDGHRRLQAAYLAQTASLDGVSTERRGLQLRLRQAEAEARRDGHLRRRAPPLLRDAGAWCWAGVQTAALRSARASRRRAAGRRLTGC